MGWFDGWFGSGSGRSDPLGKLDPKLREFLERESPIKYNTTDTQQQQAATPQPHSQSTSQQPQDQQRQQQPQNQQQQQQQEQQEQKPLVPPQSLFPDGRYAHLWKTYRPLAEVEAETKTDSEKLSDVLEAFKERKAAIGRAALENCAEEQADWTACMKSGSVAARLTMCRDEVRRFERCYNAQSRLLRALGYLSVHGRSAEVDEDIQMRADELYHRMLAQEREIERAREEGREPPVFRPLFEGVEAAAGVAGADAPVAAAGAAGAAGGGGKKLPEPSQETLAEWKKKLEKLPPEDREAEEQALRAEYRAKVEMSTQIQNLRREQAREREARRAEGKDTILDKWTMFIESWTKPKSS
ncbi:hypothetical protein VTK26DRAFT_5202 [Humicola hyalothermophila]